MHTYRGIYLYHRVLLSLGAMGWDMNTLQKCAEILVESGYKMTSTYYDSCAELQHHKEYEVDVHIDPYLDTLEGRRQADAIEDWLLSKKAGIWVMSDRCVHMAGLSAHQWRLDRIKWCLQELSEKS